MPRRLILSVSAGLLLIAALALTTSALGQGGTSPTRKALFAAMNGNKEVSATGERRAGDLNGRGSFSAIVAGNRLCYGITVTGIATPVAAHIHRGGSNVAGPIVIPLTQPSSSPGASSACVTASRTLLRNILRRPGRYYVNVHTGDFPGGAVRAQLFSRPT